MERSDEERIADEVLILRLLAGFHVDENGRQVTSYLTPGSLEEKRGRAVLARQLREGTLSFTAKELLALAIDPDAASQYVARTRKVEFKALKQGPGSDWLRNQLVIDFITKHQLAQWKQCPDRVELEAAIFEAERQFPIKRSQLMEIWAQSGRSGWFHQHERNQLVESVIDFIVKHLQAQLDDEPTVTPNLEAAIKAAKEQFGLEPGFAFVKK